MTRNRRRANAMLAVADAREAERKLLERQKLDCLEAEEMHAKLIACHLAWMWRQDEVMLAAADLNKALKKARRLISNAEEKLKEP